jgi:hypothetical protein
VGKVAAGEAVHSTPGLFATRSLEAPGPATELVRPSEAATEPAVAEKVVAGEVARSTPDQFAGQNREVPVVGAATELVRPAEAAMEPAAVGMVVAGGVAQDIPAQFATETVGAPDVGPATEVVRPAAAATELAAVGKVVVGEAVHNYPGLFAAEILEGPDVGLDTGASTGGVRAYLALANEGVRAPGIEAPGIGAAWASGLVPATELVLEAGIRADFAVAREPEMGPAIVVVRVSGHGTASPSDQASDNGTAGLVFADQALWKAEFEPASVAARSLDMETATVVVRGADLVAGVATVLHQGLVPAFGHAWVAVAGPTPAGRRGASSAHFALGVANQSGVA